MASSRTRARRRAALALLLLAAVAASCRTHAAGADAPRRVVLEPFERHALWVDEFEGQALPPGAQGGAAASVVVGAGGYESDPLLSSAPFTELLPSWNLELGAGGGALVEVAVRRADAGTWSPWLLVGECGSSAAEGEPVVRFEGGRVDVDLVRSEVPLDAVRYRVRGRDVVLHRFGLCVSRARPARTRPPSDTLEPLGPVELDVPFLSQRGQDPAIAGRICSPTSVAMVLAHHGVAAPVDQVAARAHDPRHDLYGNWPRNVQVAFELGLPGVVTRVDGWDEVAELFERGLPLVVSVGVRPGQLTGAPYEQTAGHLIVLRGFDAAGDVLVNDPAASDGATGRLTYRREELDQVWLARGGTAYLLTPPDRGGAARGAQSGFGRR